LQYGAGIGLIDYGLTNSGVLFYGIAEKELNVDLGDFDTAAQVRIGTSTAGSTDIGGNNTVEYNYTFLFSTLFKASMELQNDITVYGLTGLSFSSLSMAYSATPALDTSSTEIDFNFGLGAEYELNRDLKLGVEFADYGVGSTFAVNGFFDF